MNSSVAFPFLLLPEDAISGIEWLVGPRGEPLVPTDWLLEGWDYDQDLDILVKFEFDAAKAAEALGLAPGKFDLAAILKVGTGAGAVPRRVWEIGRARLERDGQSITLGGWVRGSDLSARMFLDLQVVLASASASGSALSPRLAGARLWSDSRDILLEGGGEFRFPVELASFSKRFAADREIANAPWYLHWIPEGLKADFAGSVRLFINSDMTSLVERILDGDDLLLQAILGDVISQMVSATLDLLISDDCQDDFEEGCLGHQVCTWISQAFPHQDLETVRSIRDQRPSKFQAAILSIADPSESDTWAG